MYYLFVWASACMYECAPCLELVPLEARRENWILGNQSYRWLWAGMKVLRMEPGSFARAASILNYRVIAPAGHALESPGSFSALYTYLFYLCGSAWLYSPQHACGGQKPTRMVDSLLPCGSWVLNSGLVPNSFTSWTVWSTWDLFKAIPRPDGGGVCL